MARLSWLVVLLVLSGCGTQVPNLNWTSQDGSGDVLFVGDVISSIKCEIQDAVYNIVQQDKEAAKTNKVRTAEYLEDWIVVVSLSLSVTQNSSLAPALVWVPKPELTVGAGAGLAATATRIDNRVYAYDLRTLIDQGPCEAYRAPDLRSPIISTDLKFLEALAGYVFPVGAGLQGALASEKAFTHQIKFTAALRGNLDPIWLLTGHVTRVSGVFGASQNNEHHVVAVFGPRDPKNKSQLARSAANVFLASQIATAIDRLPR